VGGKEGERRGEGEDNEREEEWEDRSNNARESVIRYDRYSSPSRSTRKQGGYILYGRSDTHRHFAIYVFNPCFRVLHEGDE